LIPHHVLALLFQFRQIFTTRPIFYLSLEWQVNELESIGKMVPG